MNNGIHKYKKSIALLGIYFLWISTHYMASHLYVFYCTPGSINGFIVAPFIITTPHCSGLRWCISHGADSITAMWALIGTWIATSIYSRTN